MRVAIVVPWYTANGGAEKVDGVIGEIYPNADFFALFYREQGIRRCDPARLVRTGFGRLDRGPGHFNSESYNRESGLTLTKHR